MNRYEQLWTVMNSYKLFWTVITIMNSYEQLFLPWDLLFISIKIKYFRSNLSKK